MKLKKYGKGGKYSMYNKGGVNPKKKKPNLKDTSSFQDYKTAASQFSDYNPESDTVFVGMSLDPGAAERQTERAANVSKAKGASGNNYNAIPKMYKTKNESGQTVYVSLGKYDKYSKGGTVKPKKKKPVYGPPKPPGYKEPTAEEKEEARGERAYLKRRKEADRAYKQALKEGATEAQAVKIAEKYLSQGGKMYLKGGQVKLDVNKDGEISGSDFKMLRAKKK